MTADLLERMTRALSSGLSSTTGVAADDEALYAWVADHLGVRIPRRACCPEHRAPFDAFADAYFARSPIAVWVASRGFGGKSLLLATLALTEATTLGAEVRVLGGSADQSENVVRYTDGMVDLPTFPGGMLAAGDGLRTPGRRQSGVTKSRVRLANGATMLAVAASTRAVRGPHPSRRTSTWRRSHDHGRDRRREPGEAGREALAGALGGGREGGLHRRDARRRGRDQGAHAGRHRQPAPLDPV